MVASYITEQLRGLPTSPGVYLFKDAERNILYVGKAANLRHRVSSYFGTGKGAKVAPTVFFQAAGDVHSGPVLTKVYL